MLGIDFNSGAICGALNPNSQDAVDFAHKEYDTIRKDRYDIYKIAKNTSYNVETILTIKKYLFIDKHKLENEFIRFDPDPHIAWSWIRLRNGHILPHDLILLKHELEEIKYMRQGYSQALAHDYATKKYDYSSAAQKWSETLKFRKGKLERKENNELNFNNEYYFKR